MIFDKLLKRERGWSFVVFCVVCAIAFVCRYLLASYLSTFAQKFRGKVGTELSEKDAKREEKKSYKNLRYLFNSEYDRANPVTAEQATKDYFKWMVSKSCLL